MEHPLYETMQQWLRGSGHMTKNSCHAHILSNLLKKLSSSGLEVQRHWVLACSIVDVYVLLMTLIYFTTSYHAFLNVYISDKNLKRRFFDNCWSKRHITHLTCLTKWGNWFWLPQMIIIDLWPSAKVALIWLQTYFSEFRPPIVGKFNMEHAFNLIRQSSYDYIVHVTWPKC